MDVATLDLAGGRYTVLEVGRFDMEVEMLLARAPADESAVARVRHGLVSGTTQFRMLPLIADLAGHRVLVDPGGSGDPDRMLAALGKAGIRPESIDAVVITHGHADHYWGSLDAEGRPLFNRAEFFIQRSEWEHWLDPESPQPEHAEPVRRLLRPIADCFTLLEGDGEILPGVEAIMTPGHSPGHMAVKLGGGVLHSGDAFLTSVAVEHPAWVPSWERHPAEVLASRLRILRLAAEEDLILMLCHTPLPGLGRVRAVGKTFEWVPERV